MHDMHIITFTFLLRDKLSINEKKIVTFSIIFCFNQFSNNVTILTNFNIFKHFIDEWNGYSIEVFSTRL